MRKLLFILLMLIFTLGLVMIFDTTSADVVDSSLERATWTSLVKQLLYGVLGILLGFSAYQLGAKKLLQLSPLLLFIFSLLLCLTFIPPIGKAVNGSYRWIQLGPITFQPSEFVKYLLPAFFIHYLQKKPGSFWHYLKAVSICSIPILLVLIEPNNGTAAVMVTTLLMLSFLMRISFLWWGIPVVCVLLLGAVSVASLPYAQNRIHTWLHPESDLKGRGHQPYQAKIATGSGGVWGKGPGESLQKYSYLPEAQNDYIAAIYAEEFGFSGMLLLIFLYASFTLVGLRFLEHKKEESLVFFSACIVFLISFQAFLNLGVVSGLLPSTGLNLPFFSQGGTSLIANAASIGFLMKDE